MNDTEKQQIKDNLHRALILIDEALDLLDEKEFPIAADELVFKDGNLWKPNSDSDGNLVVLLRSDWPKPDRVRAVRKHSNEEEPLVYTGLSNGDRHTYRGSLPGGQYMGARGGGGVFVYYGEQRRLIPIPGKPKERHG